MPAVTTNMSQHKEIGIKTSPKTTQTDSKLNFSEKTSPRKRNSSEFLLFQTVFGSIH